MSQLLNLDQLLPEAKHIIFGGEEHPVVTTSVEAWLQLMAHRQTILSLSTTNEGDAEGEATMAAEIVDLQVKIAAIAVPSISEDEFRKLPLSVLMKLTEAIGNEMAAGGDEDAAEGEAEGEAET